MRDQVNAAFPFEVSASGRTSLAPELEHIRQQIEQVLLTTPGERVNRPEFGCELKRLVYVGVSDEIVTAAESMAQSALTQWLPDAIAVKSVTVELDTQAARARVSIDYAVLQTGQRDRSTVVLEG